MKKILAILFCLLFLLSACKPPTSTEEVENGPIVNPSTGFYEGKTDQGEDISVWVEEINGNITVTGFLYNITLQGDGWSSKITYYQKINCNLPVDAGEFMGYLEMSDPGDTAEVSGVFTSNTAVIGRLRHTSQHESTQYGSATADIEFEVERTGALEAATLP